MYDNRDSGALSKLKINGNDIRKDGCIAIANVLNSTSITDLDISQNNLHYPDLQGVVKLCDVLKANGSLVNLNVSNNSLGPEGATALVPAM